MKPSKLLPLFIIAAVLIGVILIIFTRNGEDAPQTAPTPEARAQDAQAAAQRTQEYNNQASLKLRFDQANALLANDPNDPTQLSELALLIDDPQSTEREVKDALHAIISDLRFIGGNQSYPGGLNVEFTNALLGDNKRKVAYLPASCRRINEYGELVDDNGVPYWFHVDQQSRFTVTSAGPDQIMHTADDLAYPTD